MCHITTLGKQSGTGREACTAQPALYLEPLQAVKALSSARCVERVVRRQCFWMGESGRVGQIRAGGGGGWDQRKAPPLDSNLLPRSQPYTRLLRLLPAKYVAEIQVAPKGWWGLLRIKGEISP